MILAFGELMLRVAPEGQLRFRQALPGKVEISFAGAEANVCAALAMWGLPARYLTALPNNALADSALGVLRGLGVDTGHVLRRGQGRFGAYYVETGANQRSSTVVYDRDYSAVSLAGPGEYNFAAALDGMRWLHLTGVTPSLSEAAFDASLRLAELAKQSGLTVSCDLNFRNKLWRWRPGTEARPLARECMSRILRHVDLVVANEEDASDVLGIQAEGSAVEHGQLHAGGYEWVAREIVKQFPNIGRVAITLRESISADHNNWGAMLLDAPSGQALFAPLSASSEYQPYAIRDIVDRVGAGDSFAAGLIYAFNSPDMQSPEQALRFAVAASCLKHSIKGDFNYVSREEALALMAGQASGRVRR